MSDLGRCTIRHGEIRPRSRAVMAEFHQTRRARAERGIETHGRILKKKEKQLALLQGAPGVRTRRSLVQQAQAKEACIWELEQLIYFTKEKIDDWETIVKQEKEWTLAGQNFGIKPGKFWTNNY